MKKGSIQYAEKKGCYWLKYYGDVRLDLCQSFEIFIANMFEKTKFRSVIIDLTKAENIDSTSLGLLAKLAIDVQKKLNKKPVLISTHRDITEIITSMGFDRIFTIATKITQDQPTITRKIQINEATEAITTKQVIKAHRMLMNMNQKNHDTFHSLVHQIEDKQTSCNPFLTQKKIK